MKYIFLLLILFYQHVLSGMVKNILGVSAMCRYSPTCSEYSKTVMVKYGVVKGGYLSFIRIISCQPFFSLNF